MMDANFSLVINARQKIFGVLSWGFLPVILIILDLDYVNKINLFQIIAKCLICIMMVNVQIFKVIQNIM